MHSVVSVRHRGNAGQDKIQQFLRAGQSGESGTTSPSSSRVSCGANATCRAGSSSTPSAACRGPAPRSRGGCSRRRCGAPRGCRWSRRWPPGRRRGNQMLRVEEAALALRSDVRPHLPHHGRGNIPHPLDRREPLADAPGRRNAAQLAARIGGRFPVNRQAITHYYITTLQPNRFYYGQSDGSEHS